MGYRGTLNRPNTHLERPTYVHSHIRTFKSTIENAFNVGQANAIMKESLGRTTQFVQSIINFLQKTAVEFKETFGDPLTFGNTAELMQMFEDAKTTWRNINAGPHIQRKSELADVFVRELYAQKGDVWVGEEEQATDIILDTVVEVFGNDLASEAMKEIADNLAHKTKGRPTVNLNRLMNTSIEKALPSANRLLNRTLPLSIERRANVQAKFNSDKEKLHKFADTLRDLLERIANSKFSANAIEQLKGKFETIQSMSELKSNEAVIYDKYVKKNYGKLLNFVDRNLGFLFEGLVALEWEMREAKYGAESASQGKRSIVELVDMGKQQDATSDISLSRRTIAETADAIFGISVKSNIKREFMHDVPIDSNRFLTQVSDPTYNERFTYFLVNYKALKDWSVEFNVDNPAFLFESDKASPKLPMPEVFDSLYENFMKTSYKVSIVQALLGTIYLEESAKGGIDAEQVQKYAVPIILQVYDKSYYTHEILAKTIKTDFQGTAGYRLYLMGANLRGDAAKDPMKMWEKKYGVIKGMLANRAAGMKRDTEEQIDGYAVLKENVLNFLPKAHLHSRIKLKLTSLFPQ